MLGLIDAGGPLPPMHASYHTLMIYTRFECAGLSVPSPCDVIHLGLQDGAAQHVASALDARLREHLKSRNNLFSESASGLTISRPVLCLFDRNFELSVVSSATC